LGSCGKAAFQALMVNQGQDIGFNAGAEKIIRHFKPVNRSAA
jgi:hypothetical protein